MAGKFEVYQDKGGSYRFRLKAGNGEVVATGQGYTTMAGAKRAARPCSGRPMGPPWSRSRPSSRGGALAGLTLFPLGTYS